MVSKMSFDAHRKSAQRRRRKCRKLRTPMGARKIENRERADLSLAIGNRFGAKLKHI